MIELCKQQAVGGGVGWAGGGGVSRLKTHRHE